MSVNYCTSEGGVAVSEQHDGSGKLKFKDDGSGEGTRVLLCAWGNIGALISYLRGTPRPAHPSYGALRVSDFEIEPFDRPTGVGTWETAKVTISYKTPDTTDPEDPEAEDLYEISGNLSAVVAADAKQTWKFDNAESDPRKKVVERDVERVIPLFDHKVTLERVSQSRFASMFNAARTCIGKVGSIEGSPMGTAMYLGMEYSRKTTTDGNGYWTVTHHFNVGENDLRKELNPHTGKMEFILNKDGKKKYEEGDFSTLGVPSSGL